MRTENAKRVPQVFYGLHMVEGVAEYQDKKQGSYRICILENAIKKMDATFPGKPVFVLHSEADLEDILEDIQERADGYVIESFFNQADGKHWAKFIVVSDKGHEAIQKGWTLSNAYHPQTIPKNGEWHGVSYSKEVVDGNYDHLAIVPNPRYQESIILTPDQFKAYNESKFDELKKIANSKEEKGENQMKLSFFKKAKVEKLENGSEVSELSVTLPQSKKEVTVAQAIEIADKFENMQGYANGEHMVKIGEEEMSVNDLMKKYGEVCNELSSMKAKNEAGDDDESEVENKEDEADADAKKDLKKENEDEADADAKKAEKKEEKKSNAVDPEKKKADKAAFEKLKNAHNAPTKTPAPILLASDRTALGKSRYGSAK